MVDERWFDLDGDDFETGRFVPLEPNLAKDVVVMEGLEGVRRAVARPGHPAALYASRFLSTR